MKYGVIDSTNHYIRGFNAWADAFSFVSIHGRPDWTIISFHPADHESTPKQRAAVKFCKYILGIDFDGNIKSYQDCSSFLDEYLEIAKQTYTEVLCEFHTERGY